MKTGASCVLRHWEEHHEDMEDPPDFSYKVVHKCRTATERQIWEALEMEGFKGHISMNGKAEWGRNFLPTRVIFHREEVWSPEEEKEKEEKGSENSRKRKTINTEREEERVSGDNFSNQLSQRRKKRKEEALRGKEDQDRNDAFQLPSVHRVEPPQTETQRNDLS